jgi:hypothetical protein
MATLANEMIAACYHEGSVISTSREDQFNELIASSVKSYPTADLVNTLRHLRAAPRLNEGTFILEGHPKEGKEIIRIMSNMLAVCIGKSLEFYQSNPHHGRAKKRYERALQLLPYLYCADLRWMLVSYTHRKFICTHLPEAMSHYRTWCRRNVPPEGSHRFTRGALIA